MIGDPLPSFFTGVVLMLVFSVWLQWFSSVYDTNLAGLAIYLAVLSVNYLGDALRDTLQPRHA